LIDSEYAKEGARMIDEKKLIEAITKGEYTTGNIFADMELQQFIKDFPKVGEWIPFEVTEADEEEREAYGFAQMLRGKLPEEDEEILVTYLNGHVGEDVFMRDGYECYLDSGAEFVLDVVAWMPLPEPYREKVQE
jgi:hypothetical protein